MNRDAVEVSVIDSEGYRILDRDEVNKQIDRLKPLEVKPIMVSLDSAVLARWEYGGKRYEILVDPNLVDAFRQNPSSVNMDDFLATDEVWHDARGGDRPTEEAIESTFGTQEIDEIAAIILEKGNIQLTTNQRKEMVEQKRQLIIQEIHSTAIDPKAKSPHPKTRIELALEESRFSVDPFKRLDVQVKDAINTLKSLIPLSFEPVRIAFEFLVLVMAKQVNFYGLI